MFPIIDELATLHETLLNMHVSDNYVTTLIKEEYLGEVQYVVTVQETNNFEFTDLPAFHEDAYHSHFIAKIAYRWMMRAFR